MKRALAINTAVHGNIHPAIASGLEVRSHLFPQKINNLLVVVYDLRGHGATRYGRRIPREIRQSISGAEDHGTGHRRQNSGLICIYCV